MPTGVQWEYACRAGSSTVFSWGDLGATPTTTASTYALVNETAQGQVGPDVVGSLAPNAFGLYDMLGNVWEWTTDGNGSIRGGSWRDSLAQARSANKVALDHTTAHVLVGVRLILTP
jgi:formylglycine-generating enzyme required for sulfatase activity